MAKKKQIQPATIRTATPTAPTKQTSEGTINHWIWIGLCLILAIIAYFPAFKAEFVNWDDDVYATNSELIRNFNNFGKFFTTPVMGNYHPLTMISLAVNYALSGNKPGSYHFFNVVLHLANTGLAYWLAWRLSGGKFWVAFVTGVLFAVHPMHVESVAWVSERKDVLYAFFFLLGLIYYVRYTERQDMGNYIAFSLLFVLSLLSKPAAVVFPVVLLLLDYWREKSINWKMVVNKLPHFAIALAWGLLIAGAQKQVGATNKSEYYPFLSSLLFGFYSFMMYWVKLLVPVNLCTFYPLPPVGKPLPISYLAAPLFFIIMAIVLFLTRKKSNVPLFSVAFFLVTIALVLQIITIGSAIYSDRYVYIPSWGVFFMAGYGIYYLVEEKKKLSPSSAYALTGLVGLAMTVLCYKQSQTWSNSKNLWDQAINVQPSLRAYEKLANYYEVKNDYPKAFQNYDNVILLDSNYLDGPRNRGFLYQKTKQPKEALKDFLTCFRLSPTNPNIACQVGVVYFEMGDYANAHAYFDKACKLGPTVGLFYFNRSRCSQLLGNKAEALEDALKAQQLGMKIPDEYWPTVR